MRGLTKRGYTVDTLQKNITPNAGTMSVPAIISTPTPDRSEDVVEPMGFDLSNYRKNPIVLLEHGDEYSLPVATSEDHQGNLTVTMYPDRVEATSFFTTRDPKSYQVFGLIDSGLLRATSVNIDPLPGMAKIRSSGAPGGSRPGLHITGCELIEFSWCAIGDNPEALRKALDLGRIGGEVLLDCIKKSLSPYAARPRGIGKGWSPAPSGVLSTAQENTMCDNDDMDDDGEKSKKGVGIAKGLKPDPGEVAPDRNDLPDDDDDDTDPSDGGDAVKPYGQQVAKSVHDAMQGLCDGIGQQTKALENPRMKQHMNDLQDTMKGHMTELEALHDSEYPDHAGDLKKDMDGDAGMNEGDAADGGGLVAKSASARLQQLSPRALTQLRGYIAELGDLTNTKGMQPAIKKALKQLGSKLERLSKTGVAKSYAPAPADKKDKDEEAALQRVFTGLEKMNKVMESVLPNT